MDSDKEQERQRYNERAQDLLDNGAEILSSPIPLLLQSPYTFYNTAIETNVHRKHQVLEVGAGTGAFTEVLLHTGSHVCASDISAASLDQIKGKLYNL